jgi:hypothetical protein
MTTYYLLPQPSPARLPASGQPPLNTLEQLPPWQQIRRLRADGQREGLPDRAYPTLQLRGDRACLRALRAAELTAWEAGQPATSLRDELSPA